MAHYVCDNNSNQSTIGVFFKVIFRAVYYSLVMFFFMLIKLLTISFKFKISNIYTYNCIPSNDINDSIDKL